MNAWLWFDGMIFTVGFMLYTSDKDKESIPWWMWVLIVCAWPFVLGVVAAEIAHNARLK